MECREKDECNSVHVAHSARFSIEDEGSDPTDEHRKIDINCGSIALGPPSMTPGVCLVCQKAIPVVLLLAAGLGMTALLPCCLAAFSTYCIAYGTVRPYVCKQTHPCMKTYLLNK